MLGFWGLRGYVAVDVRVLGLQGLRFETTEKPKTTGIQKIQRNLINYIQTNKNHDFLISGLVVEYIVAIDVTRIRFSADAFATGYMGQW